LDLTLESAPRPLRLALLMLAGALALCAAPARPCHAQNTGHKNQYLLNPKFMTGSGNQPDNWRTQAWVDSPSAAAYRWIPPASAAGQGVLEVENLQANDSRWLQTITLAAGWYRFSAEIRTENVPRGRLGATISVMDDGIMSRDTRGTTDWTPVEFYLRVGPHGADIDVALRLGGYGSLNTGRALFRNASVVRVAALPPRAYPAFDLEQIRKAMTPAPTGSPISLVATFLALLTIAGWGWHEFGREAPRMSRAEARRTRAKDSGKR
jgi:hypothetical protein